VSDLGLEVHHALLAGRAVGGIARSLAHLAIWRPLLLAVVFWILYTGAATLHQIAAAAPPDVREVRAECTLTPSDKAQGVYRNWVTCQPGTGAVLISNTYSYERPAAAAGYAAGLFRLGAMVTTIGAVTVGALKLIGGGVARSQRRHPGRVKAAVDHVKHENARARRDVAATKARLGKVGERRARQWGRRWSAEAAAGEPYSSPGAVDRWLLRQTKPKSQRKADRAAKKIGRAHQRRETAEVDSMWAAELAAPEPRLNPLDGPPLSPVQRADYAGRLVDRAEADRQRLAAETAALFEGSRP
jgi:hypothetical protein